LRDYVILLHIEPVFLPSDLHAVVSIKWPT